MKTFYIISGFLGAGKTTLINNLISKINAKIAIIENDFGEINTDSILLSNKNIIVNEINAGCICCSINGDFKTALTSLIETQEFDVCLIEPSGIAKTSEIIKNLNALNLQYKNICVLDVNTAIKYFNNFGEIFDDQILNSNIIYFTKINSDFNDEKIISALSNIKSDLNIVKNLDDLLKFIFNKSCNSNFTCIKLNLPRVKLNFPLQKGKFLTKTSNIVGNFSYLTLKLSKPTNKKTIEKFIATIIDNSILRIKGFYSYNSYVEFDGVEIYFSSHKSKKLYITVIGRNLNTQHINNMWNELIPENYEI